MDAGVQQSTPMLPVTAAERVSLPNILAALRMFVPGILAGGILCATVGFLYAATAERIFVSTATLLVDPANAQLFNPEVSRAEVAATAAARIDSQVEVIKSSRIAERVIAALALNEDPEFQQRRGLTDLVLGLLNISRRPASPSMVASPETQRAQFAFTNRLGVRRVGQSLVLEISFQSRTAEKAARIANGVAEAYINAEIEVKSEAARLGSLWLQERLEQLRTQALQATRDLEQFRHGPGAENPVETNVRLAELESAAETIRRVYETYLQRLTETIQTVSYPVASARLIAPAAVPLGASYPKTGLIIAFSFVLGASLGAAAQWLMRAFDHRLRSRRQLTEELGTTYLGGIPLIRLPRRARGAGPAAVADAERLLEEMRAVRISIRHALLGRAPLCIGVTSVEQGAGKTVAAVALARVFGVTRLRTLLVDACAAHPSISEQFASGSTQGLAQVLEDHDQLPALVLPQPQDSIAVLPAGTLRGPASFGDLIAGRDGRSWLDAVAGRFDVVIVDLPALSSASDARSFAPGLDAVLLIASHRQTRLDRLEAALRTLRGAHALVLGVVVNRLDRSAQAEWR